MKRGFVKPKLFYFPKFNIKNGIDRKIVKQTPLDVSKQNGDFYCCIKPLLQFGRLLGIIPLRGLWNKTECLQYKWNTLAATVSIIVTTALSLNVLFSFLSLFQRLAGSDAGNAVEIAQAAKGPLFYLNVLLIYAFFQFKAKNLIALFSTWRKVSIDLKLKKRDIKLSRSIIILAFSIYLSALIDTILTHLTQFPVVPRGANGTLNNTIEVENETEQVYPLEVYYVRSHPFWALYVPYDPLLAVLLIVCNLVSVNAWNYADIVIISFSRALHFKFKALAECTDECLVPSLENRALYKLKGITWAEVRRDHLILCKLLDEFEAFLSPLILMSYTVNIFFICLQLHQGLTSDSQRTFLDSISSTWSFFHLIFRTMAMSITASRINEYAHKISVPIQKCSSSEYCNEVERLERMLGTSPLGLSGLGTFVLTRSFILMVLSLIFTMEIVLLQTSAAAAKQ